MNIIVKFSKLFFTPIAISFIGYFAWQEKQLLLDIFSHAKLSWLLVCIFLWGTLHFIFPLFTAMIFQHHSKNINYKTIFLIHSNRIPAKYLPGGIWHTVARATDYQHHGISLKNVGSYLLLENILTASITLSLGGSIIFFCQNSLTTGG